MKFIAIFIFGILLGTNLSAQKTKADTSMVINSSEFDYLFIEAMKNMALENYSNAESLFLSCLQIKKTDASCYYNLAKIKLIQNDLNAALVYVNSAINFDNKNIWYLLMLSSIYQELGYIDDAIKTYKVIVSLKPNDLDLYLNLSDLYVQSGKYYQALDWNDKIIKKFGPIEQCIIQKAQIYNKIKKPKKAIKAIESLLTIDPSNIRYYGILAEIYLANNQLNNALTIFEKIIVIDSLNGYANISLYDYYFKTNNYKKAFHYLSNAFLSRDIDADNKVKLILEFINSVPDQNNVLNEISGFIDILYATHPDNINILILLGNKYYYQKSYKEARDVFISVLEKRKDNFNIWQQLLSCDINLQDFNLLYYHSSEGIKYFPNQAVLYLYKGLAGNEIKLYDQALTALQFGILLIPKRDPLYKEFLTYQAEIFYKTQKLDDAFNLFDSILVIDPYNLLILNNYGYYLALENKALDKALKMSQITIDKEPENSTYLDTYAWILYKMKNYEQAYLYLKKAIDFDKTENGTLYDHFGDILYMLNKIDQAIIYWNLAYQKTPDNKIIEEKIINAKNRLNE